MKTKLVFTIIIFAVFIACNKDENNVPTEVAELKISSSTKKMVKSSSNFGIDLINVIAEKEDDDKNWMISPYSITLALAMTYNGADKETKIAMANTIKISGLEDDLINENYKSLSEKLINVDKTVNVGIANSIWYKNGFNVIPNFINVNKNYYNAEVRGLDFSNASSKNIINNWVANNTNNKIEKIINNIDANTVMFLINAIYYKGVWKYKFDSKLNKNMMFVCKSGEKKSIGMMNAQFNLRQYSNNDIIMLEMPYGRGNWVMDLIMPITDKSIDEVMANISADNWNKWVNGLSQPQKVNVFLPPFKFEYETELKEYLSTLGMGIAFNEGEANFTRINKGGELFISKVKHKTFIEVNEEGTEAAAATVVVLDYTSVGNNGNVVIFDRPFMFVIREVSTNTMLFVGKIAKP